MAAFLAALLLLAQCFRARTIGTPACVARVTSLFRGYDADDLAGIGIGFSLFGMPALSVLAGRVIAEEQALRRPVSVAITPEVVRADYASAVLESDRGPAEAAGQRTIDVPIRFAVVPARA